MRVVVPYLELRDETLEAVSVWPNLELVSLHEDPVYGYAQLLRRLWAEGETFAVVEHDVVPHPGALAELAECDHGYCAFPYEWTTCVGVAMGCTRFTSEFLSEFPLAMEIAARIPSVFGEPGHWRQLDVWLQGAVLRDLYGQQPHGHLPAVAHLNDARALALEADPEPVLEIRGRTWLEPGCVEQIANEVTR